MCTFRQPKKYFHTNKQSIQNNESFKDLLDQTIIIVPDEMTP